MSDKDKKLLMFVLIIAIVLGSYWAFGKLNTGNEKFEKELSELKTRHSDLVSKNANKATYENDTKENNALFEKVFADFNTSLSQEQTLMFLNSVEKNTGVWLKQASLNYTSQIYSFGKIGSSNPNKSGQSVYETDNVGISTTSNVSYECTYDELKEVLTYIRENGKKVTINSISFAYAAATDKLSGTMSLSFYAIAGSDREVPKVEVNDVFVGTGNIFNSETFIPSGTETTYKDKIVTDYDLYVIVNRTGSDREAVICGQSADLTNEAVVSSNNGGVENVTITVTGKEGDYRVSYKVGSQQYPAENYEAGAPLVCGDSLDLLIMSSARGTSTDSNEISLRVINESDISLNAAVVGDDLEKPRVKLDEVKGAVVFFE